MPTASKLFAAILFVALTWLVSEQVRELLPGGGRGATLLAPVNAFFGLVIGWRVLGARGGDGWMPSMGYGLTTIFAVYFWCLLFWSGWVMIKRAVEGRYSGPMDALEGMGELMLDYSILAGQTVPIVTAVIGSALVGLIVEWVARRWS